MRYKHSYSFGDITLYVDGPRPMYPNGNVQISMPSSSDQSLERAKRVQADLARAIEFAEKIKFTPADYPYLLEVQQETAQQEERGAESASQTPDTVAAKPEAELADGWGGRPMSKSWTIIILAQEDFDSTSKVFWTAKDLIGAMTHDIGFSDRAFLFDTRESYEQARQKLDAYGIEYTVEEDE